MRSTSTRLSTPKLPSWNRRGGAKRRGGHSHTFVRNAFRTILCERPLRRSRIKAFARVFPSCSRRGRHLIRSAAQNQKIGGTYDVSEICNHGSRDRFPPVFIRRSLGSTAGNRREGRQDFPEV